MAASDNSTAVHNDQRTSDFIKQCEGTRQVTVRELLQNRDLLGLPAFQRGAVWDDSGVCDLLRSLEKGYFVGTLFLWQPAELQNGVQALVPVPERKPTVLLLDGQQRVRALLDAFFPPSLAGQKCCKRAVFVNPESRGDSIFRTMGRSYNEKEKDEPKRYLPLALFRHLVEASNSIPQGSKSLLWRKGEEEHEEVLLEREAWTTTFPVDPISCDAAGEVVSRILDATIAVTVTRADESVAMDNYRRLNAGGKALQPEELDFAILTEIGSAATDTLGRMLDQWQETGATVTAASEDETPDVEGKDDVHRRDDMLSRGQERHFGLKLLVRSVGIARDLWQPDCLEESGRSLANTKEKHPKVLEQRLGDWIKHASEAILALATVLHNLHCDDRTRIPQDQAAWGALLPLLIRFPALRDPKNPRVQRLVLGVFLTGAPPEAFQDVVDSFTAEEALTRLEDKVRAKVEKENEIERIFTSQQKSFGRPVDLLYWLLRYRKAMDIVPPLNNEQSKPSVSPDKLSEQHHCTRQHIIPWSTLKETERPSRTASHWVNSLGNLTWISGNANGLSGWAHRPMTFEHFDKPDEVKKGHFLEHLDHHLKGLVENPLEPIPADSQKHKEDTTKRAEQIADAFHAWWQTLGAQAVALPASNVDPLPREACVRDLCFDWWGDAELARFAAHIARKTLAKNTQSKTWVTPGRVRLKWQGDGQLTSQTTELRYYYRGIGCEGGAPRTDMIWSADKVQIPDPHSPNDAPVLPVPSHDGDAAGRQEALSKLREQFEKLLVAL